MDSHRKRPAPLVAADGEHTLASGALHFDRLLFRIPAFAIGRRRDEPLGNRRSAQPGTWAISALVGITEFIIEPPKTSRIIESISRCIDLPSSTRLPTSLMKL